MKRTKTALLTAMACLTACTALTGCASAKPDVGHTPEEIEGWLRAEDAAVLNEDYDIILGDIDCAVSYSEKKSGRKYFEFSTSGLTVYGIADAKSNQMQEMVMKGWFSNKTMEFIVDSMTSPNDVPDNAETLVNGSTLFDTQSTCIILKELLGIELKDAYDIQTDAMGEFQTVTINEAEYNLYCVKPLEEGDGSMTVYLTTFPPDASGIEMLEEEIASYQ